MVNKRRSADMTSQPCDVKKKPYRTPSLKRHNDIIINTTGYSVQGPPTPGPPVGAQSSPTVPAATVF